MVSDGLPCDSAAPYLCPYVPVTVVRLVAADCGRGATRVRPTLPPLARLPPPPPPPSPPLEPRYAAEVTTAAAAFNLEDTTTAARAAAVVGGGTAGGACVRWTGRGGHAERQETHVSGKLDDGHSFARDVVRMKCLFRIACHQVYLYFVW